MARKKKYKVNRLLLRASSFVLFYLFVQSCRTGTPVFNRDVAPIVFNNCYKCHHTEGVAPFSLFTYSEIKKRAALIESVLNKNIMPPWPANPNYTHFKDELVLNDKDKATLLNWIDNNCPPGDTTKLPEAPAVFKHSFYGQPDLSIPYCDTIGLKGDQNDRFFLVKLPYEIEKDTVAAVIEFVPGNFKAVHHVNGHLATYKPGAKSNLYAGASYVETLTGESDSLYKWLQIQNDDGSFPILTQSAVNYLPGVLPTSYPNDMAGIKLSKKGVFILKDIHYGPVNKDTFDVSRINVFYGKKMPERQLRELQMGTLGITDIEPPLVIPADSVKRFITRASVKNDISILTINPHMHMLGSSFKAYALTSAGDTIRLINIPKWNFNWQFFYTFPKMLHIPAGSTIVAEGIYDNTRNNPFNPFHPPRTVSERNGSMRASDEMFQFIITLTDYIPGDENISLVEKGK